MTTTTTEAPKTNVIETPIEHKVFVGNLSFKTTKESLTTFAATSGKVVEATIITRGRRSLGYGFIAFSSEAEAKKAADELNHKPLDGRDINVEVARPKAEATIKEKPAQARKTKSRRSKKSQKKSTEEGTTSSSAESSTEEQPKPATKKASKKKKSTRSKKIATRATEPSKTTLFVANLPYSTTDDDLKKLFGAFKFVFAKVSRMKNGRSKGYGFVEFENEGEQLKAFESLKDINLDGRAVYLKIALSEPKLSAEEGKAEEKKIGAATEKKVEEKKAAGPVVAEKKVEENKAAATTEKKAAGPVVAEKKVEEKKATAAITEKKATPAAETKAPVKVSEEAKVEALKVNDTKK